MPTKKGGYTLEQLLVPAALSATALVARPALKIASNLTERAGKSVRAAIPSSKMFSMSRSSKPKAPKTAAKKTTKGGYETMNVLYGGNTEAGPSNYPFEVLSDPDLVGGGKKRAKPKTKKATTVKKTAKTTKKATAKKKTKKATASKKK